MISGALFLHRDSIDIKDLFKKNISKLLIVYLVWSLIYFFLSLSYCNYGSIDEVLTTIIEGSGAYQLWFIPALIMVYLWFPILASMVHGKKINVLYMIAICSLIVLYKTVSIIPNCPDFVITIMDTFSPDYYLYIVYALLGYYLSTIKIEKKRYWLVIIFVINSLVFSYLSYKLCMHYNDSVQKLYVYLTIPQFINAACVFSFFVSRDSIKINGKAAKVIKYLSECTLGVFAVHIKVLFYALNYVCWPSAENNVLVFFVYNLCIEIASFAIIMIIKKIPLINKIA